MEERLDELASLLAGLEPGVLTGAEAARLVKQFVRGEKLCAAGKALCAKRVAETRHFGTDGARDAATWLADVSGESKSSANEVLDIAEKLELLPSLDQALRAGELSGKQAHHIARAGALDPASEDELLRTARSGSLSGLREKADLVEAAARSKEEDEKRHARIHRERHFRTWIGPDGAFLGRFSLTPEDGAELLGSLSHLADGIFQKAWRDGKRESRDAYMADALVRLAKHGCSPATGASGVAPGDSEDAAGTKQSGTRRHGRADYQIVMRIDLEALARGHLLPGEESSIDGVGHVPVSVIQSYLDQAKVRLVVTDGVDVRSLYSMKRGVKRALDISLRQRDRTCVVPGCHSNFRLERDHIKEFRKRGPTSLDNLCRLCPAHHRMKTSHGFRIEGGPGRWKWLRPDGTQASADEPPPISGSSGC